VNLIRRCSNLQEFRSSPDAFQTNFRFPVGFISYTLEKLVLTMGGIGGIDEGAIRSLIRVVPNLKQFRCRRLDEIPSNVLDQFYASVPKLESLDSPINFFDYSDKHSFWRLPLTSLRSYYSHKNPDDAVLEKVADSFPMLTKIDLGFVQCSGKSIAALASLKNLREFGMHNYGGEFYDDAVERLAECTQLRHFKADTFILSPAAFTNLVISCPQLQYLEVYRVSQAVTQKIIVTMLETLVGVGARKITLKLGDGKTLRTWRTKAVTKALTNLGGLEITLAKKQ